MKRYMVNGYESMCNMVCVEADSEEEAIEKAWHGDVVEGTQDTDPGENIWKKKWTAREVVEVSANDPWNKNRTINMPK